MTTQKTLLTADDLLRLPDDGWRYELLDGVLVKMSPPGARHGGVGGNVYYALRSFVTTRGLGIVLLDVGIILRHNPDRVRAPDVCFISRERVPTGGIPSGYLEFVPDLIVEVVSPFDRRGEVRRKVEEWLRSGARLVWVVDPERRSVAVYRPGQPAQTLTEGDTLDAAPVLPDFSTAARDFFA